MGGVGSPCLLCSCKLFCVKIMKLYTFTWDGQEDKYSLKQQWSVVLPCSSALTVLCSSHAFTTVDDSAVLYTAALSGTLQLCLVHCCVLTPSRQRMIALSCTLQLCLVRCSSVRYTAALSCTLLCRSHIFMTVDDSSVLYTAALSGILQLCLVHCYVLTPSRQWMIALSCTLQLCLVHCCVVLTPP